MNKPHVLLAAYQCAPGMGSVSQIGWEWYSRLRARGPVTLVTHVRNRPHLEAAGVGPEAGVRYIDTEWFAGPLYRLATTLFRSSQHAVFLLASLDFYLYDWLAWRRLRRDPARRSWQVVHAVTPVSAAAATRLHKLGLPLVTGPLNCGLRTPRQFPDILRGDATWLYPVRNLGRLMDRWIGTTRRAKVVLAATQATRDYLGTAVADRVEAMLENAVDPQLFRATPWPEAPGPQRPLRVLFVGRLIPCKGIPMLLEAVDRVAQMRPLEVRIVGDGPMQAAWCRAAGARGLQGCVEFLGSQSLDQVAKHMSWAHVLCLPSVRESGGGVLLEAMAAARPVIAVGYGGPAEIVDDEVGRLLTPTDSTTIVRELAAALEDAFLRPDSWRVRGLKGRERAVATFSWEAKMQAAQRIYERLAAPAGSAPEPWKQVA